MLKFAILGVKMMQKVWEDHLDRRVCGWIGSLGVELAMNLKVGVPTRRCAREFCHQRYVPFRSCQGS